VISECWFMHLSNYLSTFRWGCGASEPAARGVCCLAATIHGKLLLADDYSISMRLQVLNGGQPWMAGYHITGFGMNLSDGKAPNILRICSLLLELSYIQFAAVRTRNGAKQ